MKYATMLLTGGIVGVIHAIWSVNFFTGISVLLVPIVLWYYEKNEKMEARTNECLK